MEAYNAEYQDVLDRMNGFVDEDDNFDISMELKKDIEQKAIEFTGWAFKFMPRDEDNDIDWRSLSEGRIIVESFYDGGWHASCDWDEALNHFFYHGALPRIASHNADGMELRVCSHCGRPMMRGYYLGGEYACSDECRLELYDGNQTLMEEDLSHVEEDDCETYYTEWESYYY